MGQANPPWDLMARLTFVMEYAAKMLVNLRYQRPRNTHSLFYLASLQTRVLTQETQGFQGFASSCIAPRVITKTFRNSAKINASQAKTRSLTLALSMDCPQWLWSTTVLCTQPIQVLRSDGSRTQSCPSPALSKKKKGQTHRSLLSNLCSRIQTN